MEALEVKILARLGIADPYRRAPRMNDHPLKRLLAEDHAARTREAAAMRESLEEVIEESERESPALSAQERVMLGNLLQLRRTEGARCDGAARRDRGGG